MDWWLDGWVAAPGAGAGAGWGRGGGREARPAEWTQRSIWRGRERRVEQAGARSRDAPAQGFLS
jgi:hypothetical protein